MPCVDGCDAKAALPCEARVAIEMKELSSSKATEASILETVKRSCAAVAETLMPLLTATARSSLMAAETSKLTLETM